MLAGKPFPQAPDLRLIGSAEWRATPALAFDAACEYGSAQYDDALARRRIASYASVRVGVAWRAPKGMLVHARIDNLLDREIATGLRSNGIRTIAGLRSFWLGVRKEF